ncbi:MAG: SusD/RagB family nutrient-binding outer membrane lipoprotein [Chitinophagaceae bacterium]
MKKISLIVFMGAVMLSSSCKKYFDINSNPNDASTGNITPQLLLPGSLKTTADALNSYNTYGAQIGGYMANAGGYGGFGVYFTYNFGNSNFNELWTYDNQEDYQTILDLTDGKADYAYFNAAARIMKALNFQLMVDTYNDIPYSQALKGGQYLTPTYDDAKTVYKGLAEELDKAIATINTGAASATTIALGTSDILFKADMTKWKQLANTVKLRLLIHANGKVTFTSTAFSADGFLTSDALINPGYVRDASKQNPKWSSWGFSNTGTSGNKAWMPSSWILSFYNGIKLTDPGRGAAVYYQYPSTPTNQLGNEGTGVSSSPEGSFWYASTNRDGKSAGSATGTLKGPDAGMPLLTAAESYFLQAEGLVKGLVTTGNAKDLFENGIKASFTYLYTLPAGGYLTGKNPVTDAGTYLTDNSTSPLVNFTLATSNDLKIEAIITQKYIALNMVNSNEAWNDYRRTAYPKLVNSAGATATQTFASKVSESTRPDRLPSRVLYPASEGSYNSTNVPKGVSPFTSLIFWAQ